MKIYNFFFVFTIIIKRRSTELKQKNVTQKQKKKKMSENK